MRHIHGTTVGFKVRIIDSSERKLINDIVDLHRKVFKGFFLSTMNRGFLRNLYTSFCEHHSSVLLVAFDEEKPVAFIAYSWDTSGVYEYMLKRHFIPFAWYSFLAVLRRPSTIKKFIRALSMPKDTLRDENYVKIFSLGVDPDYQGEGYGTLLLNELKHKVDFSEYEYITLETDAENNDHANRFYQKNEMKLSSVFVTPEGRKMNKYHYRKHHDENTVS